MSQAKLVSPIQQIAHGQGRILLHIGQDMRVNVQRDSWLVWLGVACLLAGLVAASLVTRR
jgi:hypothetical protein